MSAWEDPLTIRVEIRLVQKPRFGHQRAFVDSDAWNCKMLSRVYQASDIDEARSASGVVLSERKSRSGIGLL